MPKLNNSLTNYLIKNNEKKLTKAIQRATPKNNNYYQVKKYETQYNDLRGNKESEEDVRKRHVENCLVQWQAYNKDETKSIRVNEEQWIQVYNGTYNYNLTWDEMKPYFEVLKEKNNE